MKRYVFLIIVIGIVQLLNVGMAKGVQWWLKPFVDLKFSVVLLACVLLGNAFLLGFMFHAYRYPMGYLSVLWLGLLSAAVSAVMIIFMQKMGVGGALSYRALALVSLLGMIGFALYNAYSPVVRHLTITLDKPVAAPVRLAVASDLHLGALVGNRQLAKLHRLLVDEKVDVLLMPGDIMDDDTHVFQSDNMAAAFEQVIRAPTYGTAVSLGNHDLYRVPAYDSINEAIKTSGAYLLNDDIKVIDITKNGKTTHLQVIGRFDDHKQDRLPTKALLQKADSALPTVLLDHRPTHIEVHAKLPIDLQVSGHTHKGQVFPANFIVDRINRLGYGYEKINNTHFVVSSGFGFWGVPFRLGSRSEVWVIDVVGQSL